MNMQTEIRLTGSGGQGLILGGIILAEAAILDGKNAIQSQSYGPEARGGASKAEVIISIEEIDYPKVEKADLLLSLTQIACDKYINTLKENGILVVDSTIRLPENLPFNVIQIPILNTAAEEVKKPMVANIVAIGAIQAITNAVSKESLEKSVLKRVPAGTENLNKAALLAGYNLINA
ncbi:2-oxoacid:acceptor oxidoreductase family protein [Alkaliphilus oremlandii]|uniref:Pyruvate/ketoisovalerate oxidoreductase, gamma subunit n=1 Tax=Alkaliphilus oremlandii (strain OhILAs) TaxID=350688 RepID=A8MFE9_ALKOO|nr:2-oxoacid:acceptor oxidoreductase family protein [Alkaliphilus oremlandii]ABW19112.1 pyruvate/ketoisovalerate oxidoreductase, gamma subunit [Alkaliphilus oremlandii OhILAs]